MQSHHFGGQSATGSPAHVDPPRLPAAASSSDIEADRSRVRNAIVRTYHRLEAAQRKSDFEATIGAKDDLERYCNILARLAENPVGRVPSQDIDANSPGYVPGLSKQVRA